MASAEEEPSHLFQVLRCKKLAQASCYVVVTHGDDEIGRTPTVKAAADPVGKPVVFPPLASTFAVPRGAEQLAVKLVAPGALGVVFANRKIRARRRRVRRDRAARNSTADERARTRRHQRRSPSTSRRRARGRVTPRSARLFQ